MSLTISIISFLKNIYDLSLYFWFVLTRSLPGGKCPAAITRRFWFLTPLQPSTYSDAANCKVYFETFSFQTHLLSIIGFKTTTWLAISRRQTPEKIQEIICRIWLTLLKWLWWVKETLKWACLSGYKSQFNSFLVSIDHCRRYARFLNHWKRNFIVLQIGTMKSKWPLSFWLHRLCLLVAINYYPFRDTPLRGEVFRLSDNLANIIEWLREREENRHRISSVKNVSLCYSSLHETNPFFQEANSHKKGVDERSLCNVSNFGEDEMVDRSFYYLFYSSRQGKYCILAYKIRIIKRLI